LKVIKASRGISKMENSTTNPEPSLYLLAAVEVHRILKEEKPKIQAEIKALNQKKYPRMKEE